MTYNFVAYSEIENVYSSKEEQRRFRSFYNRRSSARKKGLEFSIISEELVYPDRCPLLGITLCYTNTRMLDNSPSIDRKDNTIGYTKGNTWVISNRANRLKSDSNPGELMKLALNLRKILTKG